MSTTQLYDTWFRQVRKLLPDERITRVRNLTWLIVGLCHSRSVHLGAIAAKLPFRVTRSASVQRFARFLQNPAFRVRPWYRSVAQGLLSQAAARGTLRLIIDGSKVSAGHQLLMVALAYRKRALPIAWTWVRWARGHSGVTKQLALLRYIHTLVPASASVVLLGDAEFGAIPVLRQLERWQWGYVLRQQGNSLACVCHTFTWQRLDALALAKGQEHWYPQTLLTQEHLHHTQLLTCWAPNQPKPWLLATNLPDAHQSLRAYRCRMWIEEMFGDWKGHGVNLERSSLRHVQRLSRLTCAIALLYLWLMARGAQAIKAGQRHWVDRKDRRDLSLYRIGLYIIDRFGALGRRFSIRLIPYF